MRSSGGLVYSTEAGRMCPVCRKPQAQCVCKQRALPAGCQLTIDAATDPKQRAALATQLGERIAESAELFKIKPFFLSDEFSVVDATIMPVLWRLKRYGIELPAAAQPVLRYAAIMQARPSFRASLSPAEVAMSKG